MTEGGDRLPQPTEVIHSQTAEYKLGRPLGDGGYGVVFICRHNDQDLAVKVEKYSKSMLHVELEVLRKAKEKGHKHFCEIIDYGTKKREYSFIVMTLLSRDLHKLKSEQPRRAFSRSTALRIGIETLEAIRELHEMGYLSRDVKPGNFAPGLRVNRQHRTIFMFDFGLARKYRDKNNVLLPERKEVGWRGTTRYGSIRAHKRLDLGRRDDMESWFYLLVEITKGVLPWRLVPERQAVFAAKQAARDIARVQFMFECPKEYDAFLTNIDALGYADEPEYDYFLNTLRKIVKEIDVSGREKWDWDDEDEASTASIGNTSQSSLSDGWKKEVSDKEKKISDAMSALNVTPQHPPQPPNKQ